MSLRKIIHTTLLNLINENEDTYSLYKGIEPYAKRREDFINSIKSFNDIGDDEIYKILDFFGYEGYNTEEDAFEDFKEKIESYKKMSDPVILYRAIGVKNKKLIRTDDLGEHYTLYEWNIDGDMLNSIGHENWDSDVKPYVMVVQAPLNIIDIWQTIIQNLHFPNEHEINLKNKGKGAKLIRTYKLK